MYLQVLHPERKKISKQLFGMLVKTDFCWELTQVNSLIGCALSQWLRVGIPFKPEFLLGSAIEKGAYKILMLYYAMIFHHFY